jgi:hypothetical protein
MKRQHEPWRDEVDLARLSADPRSVAAGWLVVSVMIALGTVGPTIMRLVEPGPAAATQSVTQKAPKTTLVARCGAANAGIVR